MKKKLLSVILVVAFAFSLSTIALATEYTDLQDHWAKAYMEDLADRGYLSGYTDKTMRPDENMTACETLVLLSRFYTLSDEETALIAEDYEAFVEETVDDSLSWAYDNIEICLAAEIITESELTDLALTADIEKEQLSVFLIRAMQLVTEAEALAEADLTFDDESDVSDDCRGSIAKLYELGILTGDDANNVAPQSNVTRAVVATMISRSLEYIEDSDIDLIVEAYSGASRETGIIVTIDGTSVDVCGFDGLTREYSVSSAAITVDGAVKTLSTVYEGCYAELLVDNGTVTKLKIDDDSDVEWVQGALNTVSSSSYVYVRDLETSVVSYYAVSDDAVVTEDGESDSVSSLTKGNFVTVKLEDEEVAEVCSVACDTDITGEITQLDYDTTVTLKVKDEDGTVYLFLLDISDLPTIERDDTAISIDRLKTGNSVTVSIEDCEVTSIVTNGSEDTITGELISVTSDKNGTVWVVEDEDGTETSLALDENVGVYNGTTSILLSDIQVGDEITVVVYDGTITEIYLLSSTSSSTKVTGTVLNVDTTEKQIMIITASDKLVYIDYSSVKSIINTSTGKTVSISAVEVDEQIVAYGSYSDSTNFTATAIVLE